MDKKVYCNNCKYFRIRIRSMFYDKFEKYCQFRVKIPSQKIVDQVTGVVTKRKAYMAIPVYGEYYFSLHNNLNSENNCKYFKRKLFSRKNV